VKICIVGWYGTETLGDRSILIGISKIFNEAFGECLLYLGSLNPFYTDRCLHEDIDFYGKIAPHVKIILFDSKKKSSLKSIIKKSDIIAMGGGPIMDLNALRMIRYAFKFAKKKGKKTFLLGSGVGPLFNDYFKKIALDIFKYSDSSILRDKISVNTINVLAKKYGIILKNPIVYLHDPAIIPIGYFLENTKGKKVNSYLLINLRDFPAYIFNKTKGSTLDKNIAVFIQILSDHFEKILLVPNHTFFHGNDDREYLSKVKHLSNCSKIQVVQRPLNLLEIFSLINKASACIGMRYHAIMFQTFINGRNAIIDYTLPNTGKIYGFLNSINGYSHYKDWYLNLHDENLDILAFAEKLKNLDKKEKFKYKSSIFNETTSLYTSIIKNFCK